MLMKYYKNLLQKRVFTKSDIDAMTMNSNTSKSLLHNAMKQNLIKRIKHNYYAVIDLESGRALADRFMVGSNVNDKSFISHHTAFEYYGIMNQVFKIMFVSSFRPFASFIFEHGTYEYVPEKYDFGIVNKNYVKVTDMERTILDNIKDLNRYIDLDELIQCMELIDTVNEDKLLDYMDRYHNIFLYQKAGYILSHFKDLQLSQRFFDMCKSKIGKSTRYLYNGIQYENPIYNSYWQLCVPKRLRNEYDCMGIYL